MIRAIVLSSSYTRLMRFTTLIVLITFLGLLTFPSFLQAPQTYQLSGRISDQSANPIAGAVVDVLTAGSSTVVASDTTDTNGNYSISITGGTYDVRVTPLAESGFQVTTLFDRTVTTDTVLDFALVPASPVTLSGRILDTLGNGVSGQVLTLESPDESNTLVPTDSLEPISKMAAKAKIEA